MIRLEADAKKFILAKPCANLAANFTNNPEFFT